MSIEHNNLNETTTVPPYSTQLQQHHHKHPPTMPPSTSSTSRPIPYYLSLPSESTVSIVFWIKHHSRLCPFSERSLKIYRWTTLSTKTYVFVSPTCTSISSIWLPTFFFSFSFLRDSATSFNLPTQSSFKIPDANN